MYFSTYIYFYLMIGQITTKIDYYTIVFMTIAMIISNLRQKRNMKKKIYDWFHLRSNNVMVGAMDIPMNK